MNRPDDGGSEEDCEEELDEWELFKEKALAEGGRRYRTFSIGNNGPCKRRP